MTEADQRTFQRIAGRTWPVWAVAGIGVAGALIVALAIGASPVETAVGLAACVLLALYFQFRLVLGEREATLRFGPAGVEVLQDDYTNITYWLAINRIDFGRRLILLFSGPFLVAMLPTRGQSPERLRRLRELVDRHAKWLGRTSPAPTQRPELPEGVLVRDLVSHDGAAVERRLRRFGAAITANAAFFGAGRNHPGLVHRGAGFLLLAHTRSSGVRRLLCVGARRRIFASAGRRPGAID